MSSRPLYQDATRPASERAADLLANMTLDEKIAQLGSFWIYQVLDGASLSKEKAAQLMSQGIGHVTRLAGASNLHPTQLAVLANEIQRYLIENTRLGIPAVIHEECCSGYMARGATVFPQAIGVASTWEPELVEAMGDVIRRQMRAVGTHHALAPVLDIARDPRWGRVEETFGEDPYLTAKLGTAYIKGIQSADLAQGVAATGKHFVGYGMSEGGLNWAPPHLDRRELNEVYLMPFEAAVREGKLASIMNGYHELDGVPCGSSRELLTGILREEWGFDGTVVSDYFAIRTLQTYHHIAHDKVDAAQIALEAGIDIELPFTDCYGELLAQAVRDGRIGEPLVDLAVKRMLTQKFTLGIFDNPYVNEGAVVFDTSDERQLAREIAQKSIVLLKNDGDLLPLRKDLRSIAVIGPNADSIRNLFGDYSYPSHMETLRENLKVDNVFNTPLPQDIDEAGDFIPTKSVLKAIEAMVGEDTQIEYAKGCQLTGDSTEGFAEAIRVATAADVAIVVVGEKGGLTDDSTSGEARDRADLNLTGMQSELVRAVYETGTPVVVVLANGRPISLGWIADKIPAIIEAWFPSEEGANAITDVLFGDVNPGGKLPMTFPRAVGQVPVFYAHKPSGGRSHWKTDYVEMPVTPQYAFGHGLSYTQFDYGNLRITADNARAGGEVTVQVDLTNSGARAGDEIVQVYTHQFVPRVTRPVQELKAFKRITLEPGETATLVFTLPINQLGFYDLEHRYVVQPGTVDVMVGSSSQDIRCSGSFEISGQVMDVGAHKAFFSSARVSTVNKLGTQVS
jgi:beta-glucosidase